MIVTTPETAPVRELLTCLREHHRFLTSPRARIRRHTAAAGLLRCEALLDGMCDLRENGRADVIGVLGRSLFEVWLVSLYVLLKGRDEMDKSVLIELGIEHARRSKTLADRADLSDVAKTQVQGWMDVVNNRTKPDGQPIQERPNFEQIADQLPDLLLQVEPGQRLNTKEIYNKMYRGESGYSAHPGPGLFIQYIEWGQDGDQDRLITNPGPPFPEQERLAAMLTTILAQQVYRTFNVLPDKRLETIFTELGRPAALESEATVR